MKKTLLVVMAAVLFIAAQSLVYAGGSAPKQPAQPSTGYGSKALEICSSFTTTTFGSITDGTMTYFFIPSKLKNGTTAPVIIHLHGAMLIGPEIYWSFIQHMCYQGYIVIHPQFNKGYTGILSDTNQYDMLARAIAGTNEALNRIGSIADRSKMYIWGHSTGGSLGLCWEAGGGPAAYKKVLANPNTDPNANASALQPAITALDFRAMAPATTCPVILQGGGTDSIAPIQQQCDAYNALTNASSKVIYRLQQDTYGDPDLQADHQAPICDDGIIPSFVMDMIGGNGEVDATDYRFYWAALDAALAGNNRLSFDMGKWSDGTSVKPVKTVADSTVTAVTVYQHCDYAGYMAQLPKGSYNLAALQSLGISNDDLSSLKVPAGFKATLYKDDNFTGAAKVYTADKSNLSADSFNDVASSIKIE